VKNKSLKVAFALPIFDDKVVPNFFMRQLCELLADLKNTYYEFGTWLHCFNDCTLLKAVPNDQQFLNVVNS